MTFKTRFAPSPTGYLHIGSVRTALFSWLYARRFGGQFVLRVEDTDRERSTQASIDAILDGMAWVGLDYDEGPYFQSEQFSRYREVAANMLADGSAYHCYCTPEELEAMRAEQITRGENPRYDGRCRERSEPRDEVEPVLRFANPREGVVVVDDLVRGAVEFENSGLDDLIIMRADGTPTYHFGVVIDDSDTGITHVIRGDDHLNNTPRQINIIEALGLTRPQYAHVPMILGEDGTRLSKRHGAVNVLDYREQGYLPDALLNYLVRLGWSHGDQEIFSRDEMIRLFDIKDVNPSAARFSPEKLTWTNQQHIMAADTDILSEQLAVQYKRIGIDTQQGPPLDAVIDAFRERATTLEEMAESSWYLFNDVTEIDAKAAKKHLRPVVKEPLLALRKHLAEQDLWEALEIHAALEAVAADCEVSFGKLGQPLRVAVTGGSVSPPIDITVELVGKDRTLERIDRALAYIDKRVGGGGS
jgi:glutamyl-tRNA synthetase